MKEIHYFGRSILRGIRRAYICNTLDEKCFLAFVCLLSTTVVWSVEKTSHDPCFVLLSIIVVALTPNLSTMMMTDLAKSGVFIP